MTTRRWLAVVILILGAALLWVGYSVDQSRDNYYNCRQNAMDDLHHSLSVSMNENEDPDVWVPRWRESFANWHLTLEACKTASAYDPGEL